MGTGNAKLEIGVEWWEIIDDIGLDFKNLMLVLVGRESEVGRSI